ncbi:hypothetical protein [Anaeromyxobacter terrae]|uniref:hypothetical protein n=1 Tax=Anaeromyxobacter terrae TaxID=2925406 RepID=UPI001F57C3ED|nr:hypothetical protein [Anaeromyxobacter sp. SG22]
MGPFDLEGSPIAFALAGLVVAIAFAFGVAASTEPPQPRDEGARLAYAECLVTGRDRVACAPRRDAALTLCAARRTIAECEELLAETDRSPEQVVAEAEDTRLAGPLHGSTRRAAVGAALALAALAGVVLSRRPRPARVARLAAGAVAGLALASVPALAAAAFGVLVSAVVPRSEVALVGFGLFVATFAAVVGIPVAAGVADASQRRRERVHASLAVVACGMSLWIVLVGPIPAGLAGVLQAISAVALALAGYLAPRSL